LLTVSGIYGVASYMISQRTKEIGIRMALGATTKDVVWFVLHRSMRLALIGMLVGVLLAVWLSRLLSASIEARIGDFDLVAYIAAPAVIMVAAALAVLGPVRRAAVIDPSIALRTE
jgi:putative ABC transport system permease protein